MACSIADWPRGGELCSEPFSAQEERFCWDVEDFLQKCHQERQRRLGTGDKRWRSVDFSFGGATWTLFLSLDQEDCGCRFGIHVLAHTASKAPQSDCRGKIDFEDCYGSTLKTLECRLRCVSAGSNFEVEDFLSDTELDYFLRDGFFIVCRLRISPSSAEEAPSRPDIGDVSRSAAGETDRPDPTRTRLPGGDPTAFLEDAAWPRGGDCLRRKHPSPWVTAVSWKIGSFLTECRAARESSGSSCKKLKSRDFSFGDATFTLFMSLDAREERSRIGIHFRTSVSSDEEFVCRSEIHTKSFWSEFRCESAEYHWTVSDFLSHSELDEFLSEGDDIDCTISRQTRSNREACSQTEVPSSSMSSTLDAHSQTEHLENEDKDEKKAGKEDEDAMVKLCQDIKNFFSEDHSDSDGTDDVRDLLLRTHRSMRRVRKARRNHTFTESRRHSKGSGKHKDSTFWMAVA